LTVTAVCKPIAYSITILSGMDFHWTSFYLAVYMCGTVTLCYNGRGKYLLFM